MKATYLRKLTSMYHSHLFKTLSNHLDPDLFDGRVVVRQSEFHAEAFQANVILIKIFHNDVICADHHGWLRPASIKYS